MLTLQYLRNNKDDVIARLAIKHFDAKEIAEKIISLDVDRRQTQTALDQKLSDANKISSEIGKLFSQGKKSEAEEKKSQTAALKEDSKEMELKLKQLEDEIHQ